MVSRGLIHIRMKMISVSWKRVMGWFDRFEKPVFLEQETTNLKPGLNKRKTSIKQDEKSFKNYFNRNSPDKFKIKKGEMECQIKEMRGEIERLVDEKKLGEKKVERLIGEKSMVEKNLGEAIEELEKERRKVDDLFNEKSRLVEARENLDKVVVSLQNQLVETRSAVFNMVVYVNVMQEAVESTVGDCKRKLEQVEVERDEIAVCLDEEKQNALAFNDIINNYEKKVAELLDELLEEKTKSMKKQDSVAEVNKKKSFWTALLPATTLLAAVSLAYVAGGAGP